MTTRRRRHRAVPTPTLLESLESRTLLSASIIHFQQTLYPDEKPAIANVSGVTSINAALSDLHAYIGYDTGKVVAASLALQAGGTINILATAPPGPGTHSLFVVFWQSIPNSHAVKNILTTRTSITINDYTAGAVAASGYARQAFTGVVATFTDADLPSSISGHTGPVSFSGSADHNTEIIPFIHWGDGQQGSYGTLTQNQDGTWSVTGSHVYNVAGTYSVHVTMTSFTSAALPPVQFVPLAVNAAPGDVLTPPVTVVVSGINLSPVTILDVASTVTILPTTAANTNVTAVGGVSTTFDLGTIGLGFAPEDADPSSRLSLGIIRSATPDLSGVSEYLVGIKWGDGTTSAAQLIANDNGGWDVLVTGNFSPGVIPVEVDVVGVTGSHTTVHPYDLVTSFHTSINVAVGGSLIRLD